ncbi:MAG TPA: ABC transporter ATP-binding protein [Methylococcaceae bacterium]|nr:ABC transporter ATP-binding protein [Methylococcaceae bacterium]HIN68693.1 ABC transporter ATP-binding protein [Methylococcales bacterium]HIA45603.1 ABC transporter ATP-binding protein [Methylococcaceae bacterium]HIB62661.1 ABC transporter ATP-binding protein [Methylococcaceae bacterium]HIO12035.1 ABC transporter ATP-binding protein [Methylococcales bacterium]
MMKALSIRNLTKTYGNGFTALHGIDLEVEDGDFFALLGPNGAGKSTAIGIICSLINLSAGTVRVFGHDLARQTEKVKQCIGMVPQEINFNQFETVQNIVLNQAGYYGIAYKEALIRAEKCLKHMHLWDQRHTVSRRLSGGMKRRVMIARALVHNPRLLILDEPTAGVDIEIRRSMWQLMREVNEQGTTIILTTHYLEEAESLCRNIAIIDKGTIIKHSKMADLLAQIKVNHFILDLAHRITKPPVVEGYEIVQLDSQTLQVGIPSEKGFNQLFSELTRQGISVMSMKNKSNRLESLFLDLVGG